MRTHHGVGDLVVIDAASGAVDVLAAGGTWSSPAWLADGSVVAVHESHTTPPRLCRVTGGEIDGTVRPDPSGRSGGAAHRPRTCQLSLARRHRGLRLAVPPAGARQPSTRCRRSSTRTAARRRTPVTSGTASPSTSSTRATAWFSINFRGSTTYGRDFERANHGVWGVDDTKDCLAAHDHLASLGWVDPTRVGIFGASYGSYLALRLGGRRRAAPLRLRGGEVRRLRHPHVVGAGRPRRPLDLERMMGHPSRSRAAYEAGSPIHRIERLAVPILVAHGEQDERVHPKQSVELVEALRRHGKTFEYVTYRTEGHGFLRAGPMIDFYGRLARFFDWYLR